jgi:hypothetical protein
MTDKSRIDASAVLLIGIRVKCGVYCGFVRSWFQWRMGESQIWDERVDSHPLCGTSNSIPLIAARVVAQDEYERWATEA